MKKENKSNIKNLGGSLSGMSVQSSKVSPSALHKANLIKINKINNILLSDNNFNAKIDSVHYDNNKLIIENSKFLNKLKLNALASSPWAKATVASRSSSLQPLEFRRISLKDTGLSLPLNKGIATSLASEISEIFKAEGHSNLLSPQLDKEAASHLKVKGSTQTSLFNLNQESNKDKTSNKIVSSKIPSLSIESMSAESKLKNVSETPSLSGKVDGNKLNSLNFTSNLKTRVSEATQSLTKALEYRVASFSEREEVSANNKVLYSRVIGDTTNLFIDKTKLDSNLSLSKDTYDFGGKINQQKVKQLEELNTKVDMSSLNKIKASSSITQKVYDSIIPVSPSSVALASSLSGKGKGGSYTPLTDSLRITETSPLLNNNYIGKATSVTTSLPEGQGLVGGDQTIIHKYLSNITKSNSHINISPNLSKKFGILLNYNRSVGYTFLNKILDKNKKSNLISGALPQGLGGKEEIYNLLFYFFKSIYCIISKPTILFSPDKITIRLFYYLVIPKKKVFKLFGIYYLKSLKNEWLKKNKVAVSSEASNGSKESLSSKTTTPSLSGNGKLRVNLDDMGDLTNYNSIKKIRLPFMKFKVRKVISRLKSKSPRVRNVYLNLRKFNIVKVFYNKFLLLTKILSSLFNKPVVLEITRIHNFKYDSNILANAIQLVVKNKRKNPRVAINKVYRKKNIKLLNDPNLTPRNKVITFLSGLNIYINGRLMREPIIPRITTKKFEKGASATGKVNYIDTSYITKKNRKGAYTIKVKSAQNFL